MNITEIKELLAGAPTAEQLATLAADERKGVQKLLAAYNKRLEKAAAEKERFTAMLKLERELYDEGCELIAGVDEMRQDADLWQDRWLSLPLFCPRMCLSAD